MKSQAVALLESLCQRHPGIELIGFVDEAGGVTAKRAWAHVAMMEAKPSVVFSEGHLGVAQVSWWRLASSQGLLSEQATCLVSISGVALGAWARMRLPELAPVLDIFAVDKGSPEFIAMNEEGSLLLAVTAEEDETWLYIVKRHGDQLRTVPPPL